MSPSLRQFSNFHQWGVTSAFVQSHKETTAPLQTQRDQILPHSFSFSHRDILQWNSTLGWEADRLIKNTEMHASRWHLQWEHSIAGSPARYQHTLLPPKTGHPPGAPDWWASGPGKGENTKAAMRKLSPVYMVANDENFTKRLAALIQHKNWHFCTFRNFPFPQIGAYLSNVTGLYAWGLEKLSAGCFYSLVWPKNVMTTGS